MQQCKGLVHHSDHGAQYISDTQHAYQWIQMLPVDQHDWRLLRQRHDRKSSTMARTRLNWSGNVRTIRQSFSSETGDVPAGLMVRSKESAPLTGAQTVEWNRLKPNAIKIKRSNPSHYNKEEQKRVTSSYISQDINAAYKITPINSLIWYFAF